MSLTLRSRIDGHAWTVGRHLLDRVRPPVLPPGRPWRQVVGGAGGPVLSGWLHPGPAADTLLILVHGLGGSADSGYIRRMAAAAVQRGISVLRLNLRGADRGGDDIYHAGLTDDLEAAVEAAAVAGAQRIGVIGFSLGGHVALRLAALPPPGLTAVCAICAPLDLAAGADHIDQPRRWIYRRQLLRALREIHAAASRRRRVSVPLTVAEAARITTIREWDERIVAPRFGFAGAADYYARVSAGQALPEIRLPVILAQAPADPMVPKAVSEPARVSPTIERWLLDRGGHVGFPRHVGLEGRLLDWLERRL